MEPVVEIQPEVVMPALEEPVPTVQVSDIPTTPIVDNVIEEL